MAKGLYANMNARKKKGTSRSKSKSTVSDKAYKNMQAGFPKKKSLLKKGQSVSYTFKNGVPYKGAIHEFLGNPYSGATRSLESKRLLIVEEPVVVVESKPRKKRATPYKKESQH